MQTHNITLVTAFTDHQKDRQEEETHAPTEYWVSVTDGVAWYQLTPLSVADDNCSPWGILQQTQSNKTNYYCDSE